MLIGDFGICHLDDGNRLTLTDEAVGSRLFCPPELEGGRVDQVRPSSDIYSLGKLLYWLLTGRVFPREQHRAPEWDLTKVFDNGAFEHINRLLDHMVVAHQGDRHSTAGIAAPGVHYVATLFSKKARAIFPGAPLECDFCKQGNYKTINLDDNNRLVNFGLSPASGAQWHALICQTCGNLQLFRLEHASAKSTFWGKKNGLQAGG